MTTTNNPLDVQVGGDHYKRFKIQPIEFIMANGLGFIEGNIIKYACRHQFKDGAKDVKKVIHYGELLLSLNYQEMESKVMAEVASKNNPHDHGHSQDSRLKNLADLLKLCLEEFGEDKVEDALEPVLDEWEAKKPKDEEPEVELVEEQPMPEPSAVPYVEEPIEAYPGPEALNYDMNATEPYVPEVRHKKEKKRARYESEN